MYDFEGAEEPGDSADALPRPPLLLTALEAARFSVEYPSSLVWDTLRPTSDVGRGRPVLVIPGFYADDGLTGRLRGHLRKQGWHVHGWRGGRNYGLTDAIVDALPLRLDEVYERHQEPVAVVGWSFGGLLARWLAHERPGRVSRVVCLGSPWRAQGEVTRATAMFERSAAKHGLSDRAREIVDTLRQPLDVPSTAIYSKTDGITHWQACTLDDGPTTENIAVPSSHVGLVSNPLALAVLDDRLRQDPQHPQPFRWSRCLWQATLGPVVDDEPHPAREAEDADQTPVEVMR
jgi:pimeloyl-ACP methyl ester carboxylesterase